MASGNTSANTGQYITTGTVSTASLSRWGFDLTEFTPILIQLESLDRIDDSSALAKEVYSKLKELYDDMIDETFDMFPGYAQYPKCKKDGGNPPLEEKNQYPEYKKQMKDQPVRAMDEGRRDLFREIMEKLVKDYQNCPQG